MTPRPSGATDPAPRDVRAADQLANLQALTDSTLTHLDVEDLLEELLARVCEILVCDTAAVLLLDKQAGELAATAARGIEEEVRQGVRIPLGKGFAGRIAATRSPVLLTRVDAETVTNPILSEKGIRVMVGVPLVAGDDLVGVLHIGRLDDRPFVPEDVELLQVVGDRIAGAVQSRQLVIERAAAGLLERSLLPSKLPRCEDLTFATRYVPAEHTVGGDWFDLFTLPSGQLWIVVGDVVGHGLQAAVVMGRIRSALRAYALVGDTPERVLALVDRKVDWFELGTFATIVCGVLDPPYDMMTIAVAGHPPPLVAVPGQAVQLVEVKPSPPVGTNLEERPRRSATLSLPQGANVIFYTDGLIERRRESLDVGLERLRAAISPGPAERVAGEIMRKVIGGRGPVDDVALVVVHRMAQNG